MREGRHEPKPQRVRAHLEGCETCRTTVEQAEELRGLFAEDAFELGETAAAEMRFRLEAAARAPRRVEPRRMPAAVFAIGGLAAAAAVALVVWPTEITPHLKDAPTPLARVTGVAERESKAPHESYRVVDGTATFDVRTLERGESFIVHVGTESVHVRGTSYQVEAEDGQLMSVRVTEGVVEVALDGVPNPVLRAGESWERAEPDRDADADAASDADTASASTSTSTASDADSVSFDALYRQAWSHHRASRSAAAAAAFDRLLNHPDIGAREPDVLFWSAQSHLARGNEARARARLTRLLERHPDAMRARDARRQLEAL